MNNQFKIILRKNNMTAYHAVIDVLVSVFKIPHDKDMNNLVLECHNNGTVVVFENTEEECNKIQK